MMNKLGTSDRWVHEADNLDSILAAHAIDPQQSSAITGGIEEFRRNMSMVHVFFNAL